MDGVPLTKRDVTVAADGRFSVPTTAAKVPDGAEVVALLDGRQVGNSVARTEAWLGKPGDASTDMPAPTVTVIAPKVG